MYFHVCENSLSFSEVNRIFSVNHVLQPVLSDHPSKVLYLRLRFDCNVFAFACKAYIPHTCNYRLISFQFGYNRFQCCDNRFVAVCVGLASTGGSALTSDVSLSTAGFVLSRVYLVICILRRSYVTQDVIQAVWAYVVSRCPCLCLFLQGAASKSRRSCFRNALSQ